jgi:hypothetical protein
MLRKILESITSPVTDEEFTETLDLTTTDIKINNIAWDRKTTLRDVVEIAVNCHNARFREIKRAAS